ncbi:5713_t:CDS:2 [Funneliformis geosporum]|nr:5713_t:CDS:2 [Funneliformis geosporum]
MKQNLLGFLYKLGLDQYLAEFRNYWWKIEIPTPGISFVMIRAIPLVQEPIIILN